MTDTPITACPACGSADAIDLATVRDVEMHSVPDAFTYRNCRACDSIYIAAQPRDRLHLIYPSTYYAVLGPRTPGLLERVKARLDQRLLRATLKTIPGEALSVLDVGGGSGWISTLARAVEPRIISTTIVDLNEASRAAAEQDGHAFFCQRIEDFTPAHRFDLILMLNIIEHVADPATVLAHAAKMLSDRGQILIKTPNTQTLDRSLFQRRYWGGYHCPRHWVLFNAGSFNTIAQRAGLNVRRLTYTQGAPQWAQSILGSWSNTSRTGQIMYDRPLFKLLMALFATFDLLRAPFAKTAQMFVWLQHGTANSRI